MVRLIGLFEPAIVAHIQFLEEALDIELELGFVTVEGVVFGVRGVDVTEAAPVLIAVAPKVIKGTQAFIVEREGLGPGASQHQDASVFAVEFGGEGEGEEEGKENMQGVHGQY